MPLEFTDITDRLPRNTAHPSYSMRPSLGGLDILSEHYDAERVEWPYDPVARYIRQARFHMSKDWDPGPGITRGFGLMYHYRISPDGRIWRTQPELLNLWNSSNANSRVIAVCLDLGPGQQPTYEQLASLQRFNDWMCHERPDLPGIVQARVWGHGELRQFGNDTSCPGALGPFVKRYRETGQLVARPVPPAPPPPPVELGRQFPETGYSVKGAILRYFERNGDVAIFGYPISAEREERLGDGKSYTVQYFQRARLEKHPEIGQDVVQPGLIGAELLALKK